MKDKIKLKLSYYMLYDFMSFVSDAVEIMGSEHRTIRDRNRLMILFLLHGVNVKLAVTMAKGLKKEYAVNLTIAEACALHEYYNKLTNDYVFTNVTLIVGEIDKQTA